MSSTGTAQAETAPQPLSLRDAVPLAYAMVDRLGAALDVRTLLFKGPVAEIQQFRSGKISSDVDVLVDPAGFDRYLSALEAAGWRRRREAAAPRYFATHSVSLVHDSWPCDIDVHHRYPGFFADDEKAFETLWSHRTHYVVAGLELTCADPLSSGLILAAHSLRDPMRAQSTSDLSAVSDVFGGMRDEQFDRELIETVSRLRARSTLRPLAVLLGMDFGDDDLTDEEARSWSLVVAGAGSTAFHWWVAFTDASLLGKAKVALGAFAAFKEARAEDPIAALTNAPRLGIAHRLRTLVADIRRSERAFQAHHGASRTSDGRHSPE